MSVEDRVNDLVLRWQANPHITPEELCHDCSDLLAAVRKRIDDINAAAGFPVQSTIDEVALAPEPGPTVYQSNTEGTLPPAALAGLRYRPLHFHDKGALGEVHVALDSELQRQVALKCIQARHAADPANRRRFLREAEITARLEHPGIVPVHGLVHDADGQPCYAMRFVEGQSLREAIQHFHTQDKDPDRDPGERSLALRGLLNRFISVCNTMAYAHSRGIIHRDLKPANIMLGKYGETLVVDWGLAKPVQRGDEAEASGEGTLPPSPDESEEGTRPGQTAGTPAYMSPEQAKGQWEKVGPASDIYSLGATLYSLLTGELPVDGTGVAEVLHNVQEGKIVPPRKRKKDVPPALEAVCLKALAREPKDRYATALELAGDLERWVADEPVGAWPEPLRERIKRWRRRHSTLVTASIATLLGATVILTAASVLLKLANDRADRNANTAVAESRKAKALGLQAEREAKRSEALRLASQAWGYVDGQLDLALLLCKESLDLEETEQGKSALIAALQYSPHLASFIHDQEDPVNTAATYPKKNLIATGHQSGKIVLWDIKSRQPVAKLRSGPGGGAVLSLAFSPNGKRLASGRSDKAILLWNLATRRSLPVMEMHRGPVLSLAFSPDAKLLASGGEEELIVWDARPDGTTRRPLVEKTKGVITSLVFGKLEGRMTLLAMETNWEETRFGYPKGAILRWDVERRKQIAPPFATKKLDEKSSASIALSEDGTKLAVGSWDGRITLWNIQKREVIELPKKHGAPVYSLAFDADGERLASGSEREILLWDAEAGETLLPPLRGHLHTVKWLSFALGEDSLVSCGGEKGVILWDVGEEQPCHRRYEAHDDSVWCTVFSPDGKRMASCGDDGKVHLWTLSKGTELKSLKSISYPAGVNWVAFSPDGKLLASACDDRTVRLWHVASGKSWDLSPGKSKNHQVPILTVAFSWDGRMLASGGTDNAIKLWDVATGKLLESRHEHHGAVSSVCFSPDGKTFASASYDKTVRLWDVTSGGKLKVRGRPLAGHSYHVKTVAFSPDGNLVASGGFDRTVILWDVASGKQRGQPLMGHTDAVQRVAFSPDGKLLASAGWDEMIRLWDLETGRSVGPPLIGHTESVFSVAFSPDKRRLFLASGGGDNAIILWNLYPPDWRSFVKRTANRNLTSKEWTTFFAGKPYRKTFPDLP
jgi:WD40 repeat protein/serine/threonine protein kinase